MQHEQDTEEEQQEQGQEPIDMWQRLIMANAISAMGPTIALPSSPVPIPTSGNRLSEHFVHVDTHEYVGDYCRSLVNKWRYRVEPMWAIEVCVKCPDEMGLHEARVWWDEECWYACIEIGCQHLEPMLEWLVVHELCELRRWRSTGHMMEILDMLVDGADKERLVRGFHVARNQEVEIEVYDLLGHRRPFHEREHE